MLSLLLMIILGPPMPCDAQEVTPTVPAATDQDAVVSGSSALHAGKDAAGKAEDISPAARSGESDEKSIRKLLNEKFADEWLIFASDSQAPSVWSLQTVAAEKDGDEKETILICSGANKGFAYTKEQFTDFELTLEWRYPKDVSGNSGILVYTQNEPRIWPTSVQIQLHQPKTGSIIPSGDAVTDSTQDAETNLARPVNTWNECRIECRGGVIAVEVNGKKAGQVSGAKPLKGSIALQSEGSEVHFRRMRVRPLAPLSPVPEDASKEESPAAPKQEAPPSAED